MIDQPGRRPGIQYFRNLRRHFSSGTLPIEEVTTLLKTIQKMPQTAQKFPLLFGKLKGTRRPQPFALSKETSLGSGSFERIESQIITHGKSLAWKSITATPEAKCHIV